MSEQVLEGPHKVASPRKMLGETQLAPSTTAHVPSLAQQAPEGCGQGLGEQPVPVSTKPTPQPPVTATVQAPVAGLQQPTDSSSITVRVKAPPAGVVPNDATRTW